MNLQEMEALSRERSIDENDLRNVYREVDYAGHRFGLRTLFPWEEAMAALAVKEFTDTLKAPDMWMSAVTGLALEHVDGDPDFCPRSSPSDEVYARQRLHYMSQTWTFPFLERLYREYADMQRELLDRIERVENLSGRGTQVPAASLASLTDLATSAALTGSEPLA